METCSKHCGKPLRECVMPLHNRRVSNGTHGGVEGRGLVASSYTSISKRLKVIKQSLGFHARYGAVVHIARNQNGVRLFSIYVSVNLPKSMMR